MPGVCQNADTVGSAPVQLVSVAGGLHSIARNGVDRSSPASAGFSHRTDCCPVAAGQSGIDYRQVDMTDAAGAPAVAVSDDGGYKRDSPQPRHLPGDRLARNQ
jgi:hypothetical protein